jgi:hypothetical protein
MKTRRAYVDTRYTVGGIFLGRRALDPSDGPLTNGGDALEEPLATVVRHNGLEGSGKNCYP